MDRSTLPSYEKWLEGIDGTLEAEIRGTYGVWQWYDFYDSPTKPINPREFLEYWSSLSIEEQYVHKMLTPIDILKGY